MSKKKGDLLSRRFQRQAISTDEKMDSSSAHVTQQDLHAAKKVQETEKFIVFRSNSGAPTIEDIKMESLSNVNDAFRIFFNRHTCYDLVPASSKLVVIDSELNVKKAFNALVYNGVRAAPVWDEGKQSYIGMFTITDFIKILVKFYRSPQHPMQELENHKISTWRDLLEEYTRPLTFITPEATLLDAVNTLLTMKVHRLPVVDVASGNALHILTHKRILKYLHLNMHQLPSPSFMQKSLSELKIGTYENVYTVHVKHSLLSVLKMFLEKRVSALPVLDDEKRLVDIYAKFDAINLAATRSYDNLDVTVYDALAFRRNRFDGVAVCSIEDTFIDVVNKIVDAGVHRLVVVDGEKHVHGIVSLSDILGYFIAPEIR